MDQRAAQLLRYAVFALDLNQSSSHTVGITTFCVANTHALLVLTRVGFLIIYKLKHIILHQFQKIYSPERWTSEAGVIQDFEPQFLLQVEGVPHAAHPNPFDPELVAVLTDIRLSVLKISSESLKPTKLIDLSNENESKLYHFQWLNRSNFAITLAASSKLYEMQIQKYDERGLFRSGVTIQQLRTIELSFIDPYKFIYVPPLLCSFDHQIYGAHLYLFSSSHIHQFFQDSIHLQETLELVQTVFAVSHDHSLMCFTDFFSTYEHDSNQQILINQTPLIILPCVVISRRTYEEDYLKFVWEGVVREMIFSPFEYPENAHRLALLTHKSMVVLEVNWKRTSKSGRGVRVLLEVRNSFVFGGGYNLQWLDPSLLGFLNQKKELVCFRIIEY